jgi:hypothetical protein
LTTLRGLEARPGDRIESWLVPMGNRAAMNIRFGLPLSVLLVALLVGCGRSSAHQHSAVKVSTVPIPARCSSYFGGGVAVAMCSDEGSEVLTITLDRRGARHGSTVGIAQAMGPALRDGEGFTIGPTPHGAELLVRVDFGSRRRQATALFRVPRTTAPQHLELRVVAHGDDIDGAWLEPASGRELEPERIYAPSLSSL